MKINPDFKLFFFSLFLIVSTSSAAQSFKAEIDRTVIELGDTVNVTYTYTGDANRTAPDFNVIRNNFDVLSYYPSYRKINTNGQVTELSIWELVLEPKQIGKILIPPIAFMNLNSAAIELTVEKPSQTVNTDQDIFLETIVDKSSAYVQEQITVTYRLYYSVQIEAEPEMPTINDAVIKQLETKQYQRRMNGKLYRVAEVPFVIFAQRSGTIVIPQTTWQIRVAKAGARASILGGFGRFELRKLRSQEKVLRVKPIPSGFPNDAAWLPARSLAANENWSSEELSKLVVGEPITRTIEIIGEGIESAQIPAVIDDESVQGLKTYLEPPQLKDAMNEFGVTGARVESAALVLAGHTPVKTREITIPWWNTETDALEKLVIPAQTLSAASTANAVQPEPLSADEVVDKPLANLSAEPSIPPTIDLAPTEAASTSKWLIWGLIASNLISLALLVGVLLSRSKKTETTRKNTPDHKEEANLNAQLKALKKAASTENHTLVYQNLCLIAKSHLGLSSLGALKERADRLQHPKLVSFIGSVEASVYANSAEPPNTSDLGHLEKSIKSMFSRLRSPNHGDGLKPL